ncbi:MAG: putative manganese-dependent inorganic diphosphatase [Spirochaetales bacterium]|jgi:manganese-dependent inorganic pyrophosphatase|nr:putative manganese-dependent inorganic diphosphatase [Spirochaetales bacterium]
MKKRVYVIGHRNPDADSIVSAAAYAELKRALGMTNCHAARAGNMNPQTEYIFERFRTPAPEYLPDLIPKAEYYLKEEALTVNEDTPLWNALEIMENENLRVLPVVDPLGIYKSMLHYRGFARYVTAHINPHRKSMFSVSIDHVTEVLRAQPITLFNRREVAEASIVVAASYNKFFIEHVDKMNPAQTLVIMGDRLDLQRYCLERKVRALILSHNYVLDADLAALAEENGVSVISSPYDTSSTAMLIMYSAPVGNIGDDSVPLVRLSDPIRKIREPLSRVPSRCLPVGDDEGQVKGVIFEGDLIEEPHIQIIMVDHNEHSQAIEGIENYRILEVIDHHRLGNMATRYPITFINKPVGATCTIVTNLYREQRLPMKKEIASLLLCGILADTLGLKSATTTDVDREAAEYLAEVTGLDIQTLSRELQEAASTVSARPAEELVALDMKEYQEKEADFSVSQIETNNPDELVARRDEIFAALIKAYTNKNLLFSSLLVTDVTALDSLFFVVGARPFVSALAFPRVETLQQESGSALGGGIYLLKEIVSRKKQLIPLLSELIEKAGV